MKNIYCILALIFCGTAQVFAQASGEITTKGIIYPRYTDANRPAAPLTIGTTIFNTSQNTHQYWNGSSWTNVSTPGSGGGPWSTIGNNIFNNTGNRVGINTNNPAADLEIQGGGGLVISSPYTVTTSPPTNTYTMPYSGTLPAITDDAGRILDPGGNGNFVTNTNYASYIRIQPTTIKSGYRFTFESLALGGSTIIFSLSSNINDVGNYILEINSSNSQITGKPFNLKGDIIFIHNRITSGGSSAAGFQLLFESLVGSSPTGGYSEAIGDGLSFSNSKKSFATGSSRANGNNSIAVGNSTASGSYSTAMGNGSTATGFASTAMGNGSTASGDNSTAMGYASNTNGKNYSFSIASGNGGATNDKDSQMKMNFNEFQFLTGSSKDVTITNGQITTSNSLSVFGVTNRTVGNYGYLSNTAPTGIYSATITVPHSIYGESRIIGQEFNAFSDACHKKLRSYSNGKNDLALLNQLKVSNYTFIDTVGKGGKMQMGFIAQEVEKIVPEAINKIQDYIPSIYDMARSIVYDATAHTLTVTTNKPHDFQAKEEIKLISLDKEHKVKVASIIDANTFVVANWEKPVDKIFVFGKQVNDFRTVDYDRLFTLGISSIQELSRKIEKLEEENVLLKAYKDEFSQMKADIAELKAEKKEKIAKK